MPRRYLLPGGEIISEEDMFRRHPPGRDWTPYPGPWGAGSLRSSVPDGRMPTFMPDLSYMNKTKYRGRSSDGNHTARIHEPVAPVCRGPQAMKRRHSCGDTAPRSGYTKIFRRQRSDHISGQGFERSREQAFRKDSPNRSAHNKARGERFDCTTSFDDLSLAYPSDDDEEDHGRSNHQQLNENHFNDSKHPSHSSNESRSKDNPLCDKADGKREQTPRRKADGKKKSNPGEKADDKREPTLDDKANGTKASIPKDPPWGNDSKSQTHRRRRRGA